MDKTPGPAPHELPQELFNYITELCAYGRLDLWDNHAIDALGRDGPNATLLSIGRVNKAWYAATQLLLFRELYVGSTLLHRATIDGIEVYNVQISHMPKLLDKLRRGDAVVPPRRARLDVGDGHVFKSVDGRSPLVLYNGERRWTDGSTMNHKLNGIRLQGASAVEVLMFCRLCPALNVLELVVADPGLSPDRSRADLRLPNIRPNWFLGPEWHQEAQNDSFGALEALSFTYKTDDRSYDVSEPYELLSYLLYSSPNLRRLHVDVRCPGRSLRATQPGPVLAQLRDLRITAGIPRCVSSATMPALETLLWSEPHRTQVSSLPRNLLRLAIAGDGCPPRFDLQPNLREFVFDCADVWTGSSFWYSSMQAQGIQNKADQLRAVLRHLPEDDARLDRLTLVESLSLRLLPRATFIAEIQAMLSRPTALPKTFCLLYEKGAVPIHRLDEDAIAKQPLYLEEDFAAVKNELEKKGVAVVTVSLLLLFSCYRNVELKRHRERQGAHLLTSGGWQRLSCDLFSKHLQSVCVRALF